MGLVARVGKEGNFTGPGVLNGRDILNKHLPIADDPASDIPR
jgi:hypothetical protein